MFGETDSAMVVLLNKKVKLIQGRKSERTVH